MSWLWGPDWSAGRRPLPAEQLAQGAPHAEKLGWRLGCQAYSFNRFTFYEAVDTITSLGLRYVEMYPGQKLQAVFSIEYEHNWDNSLPEIAECVKYFDSVAVRLAQA